VANFNTNCNTLWHVGDTEYLEVQVYETGTSTPVASLAGYEIEFSLFLSDGSEALTKSTSDFSAIDNVFSCSLLSTDLDTIVTTGIYNYEVRVSDVLQSRTQSLGGRISVQVMRI